MTRVLLHNRLQVAGHFVRSLEPSARLRLALIFGLIGLVLIRWVLGLTDHALELANREEIQSAVRVHAYRLGAILASIMGFTSFNSLWRSPDVDVLNRLPIDPGALFSFRLLLTMLQNAPFYLLGVMSMIPVLWAGYPDLALEAFVFLTVLFVSSAIWSMWWHIFAGASVVTPAYARLKRQLAGTMVLPERTLLLYSPFLSAASGFGIGLAAFGTMTALHRGAVLTGLLLAPLSFLPTLWIFAKTRRMFRAAYYQSLAALADGELLGEIGESAPGAAFLGAAYVDRLPPPLRPLVARDLRQAWRRNRLDHLLLLTTSGVVALLSLGQGVYWLEQGWLWPGLSLVLVLAAGQAFRLTRPQSDAPWLWLSLPVRLRQQYLARALGTLFFPLLVLPGLWLAAGWAGAGWLDALFLLVALSLLASMTAVNLALGFFTVDRVGSALYLLYGGLAVFGLLQGPDVRLLVLPIVSALTFLPLRHFKRSLAGA